jgi:hypothetical protein
LATKEKRETKQHTTTPTTAAFVEKRSPIVADGASTGTQSEDKHMCRWHAGGAKRPVCAQVVALLRREKVGAGGPVP